MLTESRLAPAYQTFANLLDMGYEHVVGAAMHAHMRRFVHMRGRTAGADVRQHSSVRQGAFLWMG